VGLGALRSREGRVKMNTYLGASYSNLVGLEPASGDRAMKQTSCRIMTYMVVECTNVKNIVVYR
jgi:hypothetical protein